MKNPNLGWDFRVAKQNHGKPKSGIKINYLPHTSCVLQRTHHPDPPDVHCIAEEPITLTIQLCIAEGPTTLTLQLGIAEGPTTLTLHLLTYNDNSLALQR